MAIDPILPREPDKEGKMMVRPLNRSRTRKIAFCVGVSVLLFAWCNTGVEPQQGAQQPSPQVPAVPPAVSINAVMVALVDHASHVLWDVEKEGQAPKSDADWNELEHHATQLTSAGPLIALGGTGQSDPGWVQLPDWKKHAQTLTNAGLAQLNAVQTKNLEALVKANGELVDVCESCHKEYKPDLPSEGIVHRHPGDAP